MIKTKDLRSGGWVDIIKKQNENSGKKWEERKIKKKT